MVSVVPPDPGWGGFGESFGKGFVGGYQDRSDEKALQKAIIDLGENPSPQDVLNAVTGAKTYKPESKQTFFKNYLGAKELEETSSKAALQREKDQNALLQGKKVAAELGYTPEETEGLNLEQVLKYDKAKKGQNSKTPITERPVTPEQQAALEVARATEGYEDMDEAAAFRTLLKAGVSRALAADEAKLIGERNKRKHELEQTHHKESSKYDEEIRNAAKTAENELEALGDIEEALNSGKVSPTNWSNIFRGFGKVGDKLADLFTTKEQAIISASLPRLLEGAKEIFGVRLSDADLKVIQDKLPGLGKSPEANKAIVGILKKYAKLNKQRGEIARRLKKENKGMRPLGYEDKVEEEVLRLRDEGMPDELVPVTAPNGKVKMVPRSVVEAAQRKK